MGVVNKQVGTDIKTRAIVEQGMYSKNGTTYHHIPGSVVYTAPLFDFDPTIKPFFNDTFGTALNQNVSFGGTPELIFDGGSGGSEWVGSGGGQWDFADAGEVTVFNGTDNSQALFEDAGTINTSSYSALSGKVDLERYSPSTQDIFFQFQVSGVPLGVAVSMNNYIDTGNFNAQEFVIPLSVFGLLGAIVDEFTMTVSRSGGARPRIAFDDFTIQETGTPLVYTVRVPESEVYCVNQINYLFIDNVSGITTVSGATENATVQNLSYNKILGVSELTNGVQFVRTQNDVRVININLKNLSDFLSFSVISDHISDGVNTFLTLSVMLDDPIILDGKTNDELSLTINDNLSGLVRFTALTRGSLRSDPTAK